MKKHKIHARNQELKIERRKLPDTGWNPAKDTSSYMDGMKALSQSTDGAFSAQASEFAVWVCNNASFGA